MRLRRALLVLIVLLAASFQFVDFALASLVLATLGLVTLLWDFFAPKKDSTVVATDIQRIDSITDDESTLKLRALEESHQLLSRENEKSLRFQRDSLARLAEYCLSVDVLKNMQESVMKQTETSTVQVTETIFAIGERSKEVGKTIQEMLKEMTTGDQSLTDDVDRVMAEIRRFGELTERFRALERGYLDDMRTIEDTVKGVLRFTGEIADLADQTNLLAINASIEAARVGNAGKGFAVIAGEVQALSKRSKNISETIGRLFRETAETVDQSLEHQTTRIRGAVGAVESSREELSTVSSALEPKVKLLERTVESARALSEGVTSELEKVTVSLQFQDAVRQILEHVVSYQEDLRRKYVDLRDSHGLAFPDDDPRFREEVDKAIGKYFTTREEWGAMGVTLDEQVDGADETRLKGDVTLF